jgi:hypothetical protein
VATTDLRGPPPRRSRLGRRSLRALAPFALVAIGIALGEGALAVVAVGVVVAVLACACSPRSSLSRRQGELCELGSGRCIEVARLLGAKWCLARRLAV